MAAILFLPHQLLNIMKSIEEQLKKHLCRDYFWRQIALSLMEEKHGMNLSLLIF
jgi:hypothetical protein